MSYREDVANFWDEYLARWTRGEVEIPARLQDWAQAYNGRGAGAVQLQHYPDPFVGDLRGETHTPRIVMLGLNPGIGFDGLQSQGGLWANRIAAKGYSQCFERSPAEDPNGWLTECGGPSLYWSKAIRFAQRWLGDASAGVHDILNMELYPWHSRLANGAMRVPPEFAKEFVFDPISEIDAELVFAFGADWFATAARMGLSVSKEFSNEELQSPAKARWRLSVFDLTQDQKLVVSSQAGYAGPPGEARLIRMKQLLS
jgi:hypothetical protein